MRCLRRAPWPYRPDAGVRDNGKLPAGSQEGDPFGIVQVFVPNGPEYHALAEQDGASA